VTRKRVLIAPDAEAQIIVVRSWWLTHRDQAPDLFDRELDAAVAAIGNAPAAFPLYRRENDADVRRVLLPRTRYALYFTIEPAHVLVVAVWHTARGSGPPLL
jgi:plasmid stabilization system protein ParE